MITSTNLGITLLLINKVLIKNLLMLFKIDVIRSFGTFTVKHLCRSLFLIKLHVWRPATLLKRNSSTGAFLWNCEIFKNNFFIEHLRWLLLGYCVSIWGMYYKLRLLLVEDWVTLTNIEDQYLPKLAVKMFSKYFL